MSVELNHTIIWCSDKERSATFFTEIFARAPAEPVGIFLMAPLDNGVSLDFASADGPISMQHYAFSIDRDEFDGALGRVKARDLTFWADPGRTQPNATYLHEGNRGFYFLDPDGHLLEILAPA